jgi:hypothetical protein
LLMLQLQRNGMAVVGSTAAGSGSGQRGSKHGQQR